MPKLLFRVEDFVDESGKKTIMIDAKSLHGYLKIRSKYNDWFSRRKVFFDKPVVPKQNFHIHSGIYHLISTEDAKKIIQLERVLYPNEIIRFLDSLNSNNVVEQNEPIVCDCTIPIVEYYDIKGCRIVCAKSIYKNYIVGADFTSWFKKCATYANLEENRDYVKILRPDGFYCRTYTDCLIEINLLRESLEKWLSNSRSKHKEDYVLAVSVLKSCTEPKYDPTKESQATALNELSNKLTNKFPGMVSALPNPAEQTTEDLSRSHVATTLPEPSAQNIAKNPFVVHNRPYMCQNCLAETTNTEAKFCWKCGREIKTPEQRLIDELQSICSLSQHVPATARDKFIRTINSAVAYIKGDEANLTEE